MPANGWEYRQNNLKKKKKKKKKREHRKGENAMLTGELFVELT